MHQLSPCALLCLVYYAQAHKDQADRVQHDALQQRNDLHQHRLAALASSNGSNGTAAAAAPAAAAGAGAAGKAGPPAVPESKVPADWREVKFTTKFKAEFGTFLKVVGGPEQLGAWEVADAPPLQWSDGDYWNITLLLPPGQHEFKVRHMYVGSVLMQEG
jgi:hypothetical protein